MKKYFLGKKMYEKNYFLQKKQDFFMTIFFLQKKYFLQKKNIYEKKYFLQKKIFLCITKKNYKKKCLRNFFFTKKIFH